jgi:AraC-like DNA-binding protein
MSHDTLSDVLRSIRLRSAVFYFVSGRGQWAAEAPPAQEIAAAVMPGAERVIEYHVVTEGECWAAIVGQPPVRLRRGDIVMLPQGDPHVMSSAPGMRADSNARAYYEMDRSQRPFRVAYDGPGEPRISRFQEDTSAADADGVSATLVCGFIGCDVRPFNPLMAALPRLLHLPSSGSGWSVQFLELAAAETRDRRPGGEVLLERISEMMFVDAVRRHVETLPPSSGGWLAGLRDRYVGRALTLLHQHPGAPWSIEELSRQVGLSRSALHERFIAFVGQPPIHYLAQWRMQVAARLLRDTASSVAAIALEVGYDSEAAFARAFKRLVGMPPATWRRMGAAPSDAATPVPLAGR